jgi:hypothetical protein
MAQQRTFAAGKHGRDPVGASAEPLVAEGVDATVQGVEASRFESPLDHATRQAGVEQLAARDYAVLAGCQRRQLPFTLGEPLAQVPFKTCLQLTTHTVV